MEFFLPTNPLPVVVGRVCPPVGLHFDVAQDHVLDGRWQSWDLPWDVGFPATEGFGEVLKDGPSFVLLDTYKYRVSNARLISFPKSNEHC